MTQKEENPKKISLAKLLMLCLAVTMLSYIINFYSLVSLDTTNAMIVFSPVFSALGFYLASAKNRTNWLCSFTAAILYAFNPFTITLTSYSPANLLAYSMIPWLMIPERIMSAKKSGSKILSVILSLLPFAGIIMFYNMISSPEIMGKLNLGPLYILPINLKLNLQTLRSLIDPLSVEPTQLILSFYYLPLILLATGLYSLRNKARIIPILLFCLAVELSMDSPLMSTPPAIWLAIVVCYCCFVVSHGLDYILKLLKISNLDIIAKILVCLIIGETAFLSMLIADKMIFIP